MRQLVQWCGVVAAAVSIGGGCATSIVPTPDTGSLDAGSLDAGSLDAPTDGALPSYVTPSPDGLGYCCAPQLDSGCSSPGLRVGGFGRTPEECLGAWTDIAAGPMTRMVIDEHGCPMWDFGTVVYCNAPLVDAGEDSGPPDAGSDAGPPVPGADCSTGHGCERGVVDAAGACVGAGVRPAGTLCHAAIGPCDTSSYCDGTSVDCVLCPIERDVGCAGGYCDGFGACAPPPGHDAGLPDAGCAPRAGSECGSAPACQQRYVSCDGTCGPAVRAPDGTPCGGGAVCVLGGCTIVKSECFACDTTHPCEHGRVSFAGGAPTCVATGLVLGGTLCRGARGPCDVDEACDGASADCPPDTYAPPGTPCPGGACDGAGTCVP